MQEFESVYDLTYNMGSDAGLLSSGVVGGILAAFGVFIIIALVLAIFEIVGTFKVLKKMGKHPVGAFISPVGTFQIMEGVNLNPWWLLIIAAASLLAIIPIIGLLAYLVVVIYFYIIYNKSVAKSFGIETNGFVVGLVLLHPIFIFILGIKDHEYVGPRPAKDILFGDKTPAPTNTTPQEPTNTEEN